MIRRYICTRAVHGISILFVGYLFLAGGLNVSAIIDPIQAGAGRVESSVLKGVVKVNASPKQAGQTVTGTGFLVSPGDKEWCCEATYRVPRHKQTRGE
jgi:hypothetical protein